MTVRIPRLALLAALGMAAAGVYGLVRARQTKVVNALDFIIDPGDGHDRTIMLEKAPNLRDIGGYRTTDGRCVRWGMVYRAGTLANLSEADLETLARLGLRLVCDLRSAEEAQKAPDRLPRPAPRAVHLPVLADDDTSRQLRALLFDRRQLRTLLLRGYTEVIIDDNPGVIGGVFRLLAEDDALPALIHCAAGKDRTGVVIALLLIALGVPEETAIADYTLSNHHYDHFLTIADQAVKPLGLFGIRGRDLQPLLIADAANLRATLDHIRSRYGSVEAYLRDRAGVDDSILARLKERLLE